MTMTDNGHAGTLIVFTEEDAAITDATYEP